MVRAVAIVGQLVKETWPGLEKRHGLAALIFGIFDVARAILSRISQGRDRPTLLSGAPDKGVPGPRWARVR